MRENFDPADGDFNPWRGDLPIELWRARFLPGMKWPRGSGGGWRLLMQTFDTALDQLPTQLVALDALFTVGVFDQSGFQAQR